MRRTHALQWHFGMERMRNAWVRGMNEPAICQVRIGAVSPLAVQCLVGRMYIMR